MRRFIFEEPTPINYKKPAKKKSTLSDFIRDLSKYPDKWVLVTRTSKTQNYYHEYQRMFPNLRVATRSNPGRNTWSIFFIWENDEDTAKRLNKNAERRNKVASKRQTVQDNLPTSETSVFGLVFPQVTHE